MLIFRAEELIRRDATTIWRHLTVPELMARWMSSVKELRSEDGQPLQRGSTYVFTAATGAHSRAQVVECDPERLIALRSVQAGFTATYRYGIQPNGDGCRVTLEANCSASGFARLLAPLIRPLIRRTDGDQVREIKRIVESS